MRILDTTINLNCMVLGLLREIQNLMKKNQQHWSKLFLLDILKIIDDIKEESEVFFYTKHNFVFD